jgi:hypothetical protein
MAISQRNGTSTITPVNGDYGVDRWTFGLAQSSKLTSAQTTTAPAGFNFSTLITSSSSYTPLTNDLFRFTQLIEGFNFADLGFGTANVKTFTLSFWVRSSLTGTFGGSLQNNNNDRSYPFTYTINAADTFEYKTVTVAGDTTGTWVGATNGIGLYVNFSMGAGSGRLGTAGSWQAAGYYGATGQVDLVATSGATWYITGVQLEVGTQATSFEYRQYGQELALCQRYYYTSGTLANPTNARGGYTGFAYSNGSEAYGSAKFAVTMRTAPSVVMFDNSGTTGTVTQAGQANGIAGTANSINVQGFYGVDKTSGTWASQSSTNPIVAGFTASAEL